MRNGLRAPLDDMILLSLSSVLEKKSKCSFSDLVKECFTRYPTYYSLSEIPEYPDSLKLDRPLRSLRSKGLLKGSPKTHYSFTKAGKEYLDNLKRINMGKGVPKQNNITRSPLLQKTEEVLKSKDFKIFKKSPNKFSPENMRFRSIMAVTLETPKKVLLKETELLIDLAKKKGAKTLAKYLKIYTNYYSGK